MEFVLLGVLVLMAASVQSGTGFGFSILSTPFLLLLFPAHDGIQLNIILSLLLSLIMTFRTRKEVHWGIFKRLVSGSLIGFIPGVLLFVHLDVTPLIAMAGGAILAFTALLFANLRMQPSKGKEVVTGVLSGLLTGSIGVPGPPLLIYFAGARIDKAVLRSTTLAYFSLIYLLSLLLQGYFYGISDEIPELLLGALPFLLLGIYFGQLLFKRLDQQLFLKFIYVLLFFSGIYLLVSVF